MKAFRFVHLNVHSHYSINDGCASIRELVDAAIKDKMPGVAITDNGNMFGVMEFFDYVSRINNERRQTVKKPFKPIIGCELYVAPGAKEDKKLCKHCKGYRLTVLAKNYQGYKNLIKIVSNSWTDGFYMRARTDYHDLEKYHEGIIVLSGVVGSEVYSHVVSDDIAVQDTIVEHQVGKVVFIVDNHPFLPCLETKSFAHFEQKLLQMSYQGILQIAFRECFRTQAKKLKREWIPDGKYRILVLFRFGYQQFWLRAHSCAEIEVCRYLSAQFFHTPTTAYALRFVEETCQGVIYGQHLTDMRK